MTPTSEQSPEGFILDVMSVTALQSIVYPIKERKTRK
jgi:hypothetical protein